MITKGYVEEILNNNMVRVRCPSYDGIGNFNMDNNNSAPICSMSGITCSINVGDTVFVGFENDNRYNPVVLGCLFLGKDSSYNSKLDMELESLEILNSSKLSSDTSIKNVSKDDINNLLNLNHNIKETFNKFDDDLDSNNKTIDELNNNLDKLFEDILELCNNSISLLERLENIKKIIGEYGDTEEITLFGRLCTYIKNLNKLNELLGQIEDGQSVSSMIGDLNQKINEAIDAITKSHLPSSGTSSSANMISRAEKMVNIQWIPNNTLKKWNSSDVFNAGTTYYGMPYSMFGFAYSYDDWLEKASDNMTYKGEVSGWGTREGPKYGSCCADFVSEVLGLPSIIRTCSGLASCSELTVLSDDEAKVSNIKVGDVLLASSGHHVMWVGGVSEDSLTIYHQSPPQASRITLSKTTNNSDGFVYYGELYNKILRPSESLMGDFNDDSNNLSGDWICKGSKTYGDYSGQALTENEYQHNALCFWRICKSSGWTPQAAAGAFSNTYGESTGNPWAHGTGGGGLFGFTPFDSGTAYGTGIYDYASNVLGDAERRWNGDDQVGYINWQASNIESNGWTGIFTSRGSGYWNYTPEGVSDNLSLRGYMGLTISATECAKLWLSRYGVVSTSYHGSNVDNVVNSHTIKAEELYNLYTRY